MSGWERQEFRGYEPKVVALDFDETISDNEPLWLQVMLALEKGGYHVIVCTWRKPDMYPEDLQFLVDKGFKVYYTSGEAKQVYMARQKIRVDIWIDDNPYAILNNNY